jgi:hypothetical protein
MMERYLAEFCPYCGDDVNLGHCEMCCPPSVIEKITRMKERNAKLLELYSASPARIVESCMNTKAPIGPSGENLGNIEARLEAALLPR